MILAGAAVLAWCYWRLSWTVPATSDGAAIALQAHDMLHGNLLLHGWTIGDVSFYTTELPEYMLVELARGMDTGTIHIAAAVTYTLLVLLTGLLARGRTRGYEGLCRGLLGTGITLAPQLGFGAFVLLLSPDHVGTEVPLMAAWLLLARVEDPSTALSRGTSPGPPDPRARLMKSEDIARPKLVSRPWWVPVVLGVLLAWVQVGDRVSVLTAVVPLIVVCCWRILRARVTGRPWRAVRFEFALVAAAILSVAAAEAAGRVLTALGGFHAAQLKFLPSPLIGTHLRLTGWGILELFGANFTGISGAAATFFAVVHLVGLALAAAGLVLALARFLRGRPETDLVSSVLAVAICGNLAAFVFTTAPGTVIGTGYGAREIAAILPLGAVLAGRELPVRPGGAAGETREVGRGRLAGETLPVLAGRVSTAGRWRAGIIRSGKSWVLATGLAVLACYAAALGYGAAQPAAPAQGADLARWLSAHHLHYGLGGVVSNITSVQSRGQVWVAIVSVKGGRVAARHYQSARLWYDPKRHEATFLVAAAPGPGHGSAADQVPRQAVLRTFGPPAHVYHFSGYTVMIWDTNLLPLLKPEL